MNFIGRKTAAVILLLFVFYLALLGWLVGSKNVFAALVFLWPVEMIGFVGVLGPICWFAYLGGRCLPALGTRTANRATKYIAYIGISLLPGAAGIFSVLLLHLGCICVVERLESGRAHRTYNEIRSIEMACDKLFSDAGTRDLNKLLEGMEGQEQRNIDVKTLMTALLYKGHDAQVPLRSEVRKKLAPEYTDFSTDAWGRPYEFVDRPVRDGTVQVRSLGRDGIASEDDIYSQSPRWREQGSDFYDPSAVNATPFARIYRMITGRSLL